jgi:hypothetical protein
MKRLLTLITLISIISCRIFHPSPQSPEFIFNGRSYNTAIVQQTPVKSAYKNEGACIIENEFSLNLKTLDGKSFYGIVQDARTLDSLPWVTVQIQFSDSSKQDIVTNQKGIFAIDNLLIAHQIHLKFVGYRELVIDLKDLLEVSQ